MRALLLANRSDADPGFVGEHLRRAGYAFFECHRESPGDWPTLDGIELVLSLGSQWSVYWDRVRDSVTAEAKLLRDAHDSAIPVMGICFGGQVLAHALGGSVAKAPEPEVGWFDVESSISALAGDGPWFQWHADRFTPPSSAVRLAHSDRAEQAFRIGRTLGVQFHPEVNESIVERWSREGINELSALGIDPPELVQRIRGEAERCREAAGRLVQWFCTDIIGS